MLSPRMPYRGLQRRRTTRRRWNGDSGVTLVEMLVAIVIIGVIFSAAASAIISLTRASAHSERRVQATAIMTALHERFQSIPWNDAALYEDDLPNLAGAGLGTVATGSTPTVGGLELVTIESDGPLLVPTVPRARTVVPQDGREYTVYQAVTWATRDGAADRSIKRLITVVEWEVFGQPRSQLLDSERAAVSSELEPNPLQVPAFDPLPSQVQLDAAGSNTQLITFEAVFPDPILLSVTNVQAEFGTLDGDDEEQSEVRALVPELLNPRIFRATIPIGDRRFPDGTQQIRLMWDQSGAPRSLEVPQTFVPFDPTVIATQTVGTVDSLTVTPVGDVIVGRYPPGQNQLCQDLVITATVTGVNDTQRVVARFNPSSGPTSEDLVLQPDGSYVLEWDQRESSPWVPGNAGGSTVTDDLRVRVESRDTSAQSEEVDIGLTFRRVAGSNGQCP